MTPDMVFSLLGFAGIMSLSPGPANFMLLASGANFGVRRSLPLLFGISFGFLFMVLLMGLGLGEVLRMYPQIALVLRIVCGAYVLWLALRIARSRPALREEGAGGGMSAPIGFVQAALFQWLNPKAWAVALLVTVTYQIPGPRLVSLGLTIGLFGLVNIPCIGAWAVSGAALCRFLSRGRRVATFNIVMAALLVAFTIPMLFGA